MEAAVHLQATSAGFRVEGWPIKERERDEMEGVGLGAREALGARTRGAKNYQRTNVQSCPIRDMFVLQ